MRPQEVVVRHNECGESNGAVGGFESGCGTDVEFEGTVEAFDELFKGSEFGGYFVEVLESDDLLKRDLMFFVAAGVEEHGASGVGRVAIGDEGKFLVGAGGADGFIHGDGGGESFPGVGDVVGSDFVVL